MPWLRLIGSTLVLSMTVIALAAIAAGTLVQIFSPERSAGVVVLLGFGSSIIVGVMGLLKTLASLHEHVDDLHDKVDHIRKREEEGG